jgi:hypothetical protein
VKPASARARFWQCLSAALTAISAWPKDPDLNSDLSRELRNSIDRRIPS